MCGFCKTTKLAKACPMCGSVAAAPKAAPPRASPPATPAPSFNRSVVVAKIRESYAKGEKNVAAALIVGLANGATKAEDLGMLVNLDRLAAAAGHISDAQIAARRRIVGRAVRSLGFDPLEGLRSTPPSPRPTSAPVNDDANRVISAVVSDAGPRPYVTPLELGEGLGAPLRAGDWAGLYQRVKAGTITEAEAIEFGQLWAAK